MSGKRSEIFLLEVVGSNLGGGRRGSICGLSEEIVGYYTRCAFCVMFWYVVRVGFGVRGGVQGSGGCVWGV